MKSTFSVLGTSLDAIAAAFKAAIALLLLIMLAINAFNIASRSIIGEAYDGVFHWTMLMFIWATCLGVFVYMRENRDVVVDLIAARMPLPIRKVLGVFADMIGVLFMYMVLSPAIELIGLQTGHMETIALPIYVNSLPLFLSALCLVAHFALHALQVLTGDIEPFPKSDPLEHLDKGAAK
ncbi:TRAP-type C4-dicarboxylate transport system permease small subunit [Pacificibacter maritimus]|uniref:TRAP transporter small permease protein n=1 Tax=Pacificibacter maritimus TaxID=762213 RepID=A0A3N4UQ23_9RHOB|nr:TRAP transporter small permease [Pacificibacter maritimus]RPE72158.1 TRAP-type C4-dicarboxylate transport system permease small subunit [Pacificibacter maritimus]